MRLMHSRGREYKQNQKRDKIIQENLILQNKLKQINSRNLDQMGRSSAAAAVSAFDSPMI